MNTPTPTPRTDAATYPADCLGTTLVTHRDCARALELEVTALIAERDQLRAELAAERARLDYVLKNDCPWSDRNEIDEDIKKMSAESKK
jgi:hypothetical protein